MGATATVGQFAESLGGGKPWLKVSGEEKVGVPVERLQLDISVEDWEFLRQLARYRNAIAKARGIRLKKQNSRKSVGEDFIAIQCQRERQGLETIVAALGPLPDADDHEAMERYARKVIAWDKRQG